MSVLVASPVVIAPERLVAETRVDFRSAALGLLERAGESDRPSLNIEMAETKDVDASGLGILVLVQKRARERGLTTCLAHAQPQVRTLLRLTKLESLFTFE